MRAPVSNDLMRVKGLGCGYFPFPSEITGNKDTLVRGCLFILITKGPVGANYKQLPGQIMPIAWPYTQQLSFSVRHGPLIGPSTVVDKLKAPGCLKGALAVESARLSNRAGS